ncbi:hypothetical protein Pst134EA_032911 [Puccinia striiformis f. sp. tritici]|uniref:uncharacterized protein n=1 Tax=Puccinia striiformis f. sp. tritici TaxID=168172 RepID=UPI0020080ABB|nr:uncharacterized protein Pst134EA_032911 [Puccinia striiformis f. sp. tritici]KAH9441519.1 hypothetical protein Pst134EA_032911 [Puccinia striiformis f. sp. tritici]
MEQNDERLESLYSKISSIKNVCHDRYSFRLIVPKSTTEPNRKKLSHLIPQNPQSNHLFVVMKPQAEELMFQNSSRFSRTIQAGSSQRKTIIYAVGGGRWPILPLPDIRMTDIKP